MATPKFALHASQRIQVDSFCPFLRLFTRPGSRMKGLLRLTMSVMSFSMAFSMVSSFVNPPTRLMGVGLMAALIFTACPAKSKCGVLWVLRPCPEVLSSSSASSAYLDEVYSLIRDGFGYFYRVFYHEALWAEVVAV